MKLVRTADPTIMTMANKDTVRLHAQPTVILLPSRVDEAVDKILDPRKDNDSETMDYSK